MEELKSIKLLRPCISILVFLTTIIVYTSGLHSHDEDYPTEKEFDQYFDALNKALDFCVKYQHYVDINFQFGLFVADMSLRQFVSEDRSTISNDMRSKLENLLKKIDVLSEYYHSMVEQHHCYKKEVALLFYNKWPNPPRVFQTETQTRIMTPKELTSIYHAWDDYHYDVYNIEDDKPPPAEIDECIALMVMNRPFRLVVKSQANCLLRPRCTQVMVAYNELRYYGYTLTRRIALLMVAHFSENCVVMSEATDKEKADLYCNMCLNEAEYIALNGFKIPELMFEQIALCGLFGHAQFIRNHWFKNLLQFQTSVGCFSMKLATGNFEAEELREDNETTWYLEGPDIIFGQCNGHFSGGAIASLVHGLRYIIETYY